MQKEVASVQRLERIKHGFAKVITERDINKAMVVQLQKALALEKKRGDKESDSICLGKKIVGRRFLHRQKFTLH